MAVWFTNALLSTYWNSCARVVVLFVQERCWVRLKSPMSCLYWLSTPVLAGREISLIMAARYREKSIGDRTQPCLSPTLIGNESEKTRWGFTRPSVPWWNIRIRDTKLSGQPKRTRMALITGFGTMSNSFRGSQWFLLLTTLLLELLYTEDNVDSTSWKAGNHIGILDGSLLQRGEVDSAIFEQRFCQRCLGGWWHENFRWGSGPLFWISWHCCHLNSLQGLFYLPRLSVSGALAVSSVRGQHERKFPRSCRVRELLQVSWSEAFLSIHGRLWRATSNVE